MESQEMVTQTFGRLEQNVLQRHSEKILWNLQGFVCLFWVYFFIVRYSFFFIKGQHKQEEWSWPNLKNERPLRHRIQNCITKWLFTSSFSFFSPLLFSYTLSGCGRIPTARREVLQKISAPGAENKWQEGMKKDQGNFGWKLLNLIRVNLQRAIVCKSQDCWVLPGASRDGHPSKRGLRTTAVDIDSRKTKKMLCIVNNEHFSGFLI